MRFAVMIEPQQGLSYEEQLAFARRSESVGFEALFRSDHYESFPGPIGRPTTDAWTVIAGLARETERIRLGALVSPVTFRLPGAMARTIATVDEMSGGRIEIGLGAGWHEQEHRRHGFPFPPIEDRADMLEEQLAIVTGLLTEPDGWSYQGRHYTIEDARFAARLVQRPRPPVIVGGSGSPRSTRIAARYADEFNVTTAGPARAAHRFALVDEACRSIGRDPATMVHSVMVTTLVGGTSREVARRGADLMELLGETTSFDSWVDDRRGRWLLGTPDEARATVDAFAAAGAERLVLQTLIPRDLDMIDLLAETLLPPTS